MFNEWAPFAAKFCWPARNTSIASIAMIWGRILRLSPILGVRLRQIALCFLYCRTKSLIASANAAESRAGTIKPT